MKSIFGFKILNSWQSLFSTYIFIILQHFLSPIFGINKEEIVAGSLFNIIINVSTIILLINSILQRAKPFIFLWTISITPLIIITPLLLNRLFFNLNQLISIISL